MPGARLVNSSIVLVVENNAPQLFSPDFLKAKGVVPAAATTERSVTLPPISQAAFTGGLTFEAVEKRIKLELRYPESQQVPDELGSDGLEAMSIALAREASLMRLESVGVNFRWVLEGADLQRFVVERFRAYRVDALNLSTDFPGFTRRYIAFATATLGSQLTGQQGLVLDFNYDGRVSADLSNDGRLEETEFKIGSRARCFEDARGFTDDI